MRKFKFMILTLILLLAALGCEQKEKPALEIGKIDVSAEEFDKAFRSSRFFDPKGSKRKEFLDTFIARKLMLNEAEEFGLDKDPGFLQDIQLFWEQSLLKLLISKKIKELSETIEIGDQMVRDYYEVNKKEKYSDKSLKEVAGQIKMALFKEKAAAAITEWVNSLRRKSKIVIDYKLLGLEVSK